MISVYSMDQFGTYMEQQRKLEHSQNFIRRPELVVELIGLTNIGPGDLVIEIGPGKGVITKELLKQAGSVTAIERDPGFTKALSILNTHGNFQLVIGDFLEWQLPTGNYKIFSNIPFNYTADIMHKLTSSDNLPTDMYLIMQEAAAHRFAGTPYGEPSLMSTLIAIDFSVNIIRIINRDSFEPKPNVDVVFVHFAKHLSPKIPDEVRQLFRDFVVFGYTQWAATVLDSFKDVFSKRQRSIIAKSQKLQSLKSKELTIDQWIGLFRAFGQYVGESKKQRVRESEKRLKEQQRKLDKSYRTRHNNT